jgi:hypothetical protein
MQPMRWKGFNGAKQRHPSGVSCPLVGKIFWTREWRITYGATPASVAVRCPEVHALLEAAVEMNDNRQAAVMNPVGSLQKLCQLANAVVDKAMQEEGKIP